MNIIWKILSLLLKVTRLTLFAFPILFLGAFTLPLTLFGWQGWCILCVMYFEGCSPAEARRLIREGIYTFNSDIGYEGHLKNPASNTTDFSNPYDPYMSSNTRSVYYRGIGSNQ